MGSIITLSHGSGGAKSHELIEKVFMPILGEIMDFEGEDGGVFEFDFGRDSTLDSKLDSTLNSARDSGVQKGVTSTDSYIVYPLFFKGGDIGKLSVCGSSNDVTMMGGKPRYLNIGFIIEEGFDINTLKKIVESIRKECDNLGLRILSADTKVLPTFSNHTSKNLFINTTCIGNLQKEGLSAKNLSHNDAIIISGNIGAHGARIFLEQNDMQIDSNICSDCASLYPMIAPLFACDMRLSALRDATRGGLSAVLNEWAMSSNACIEIDENSVGVDNEVLGVCEMLGLEAFELANEGLCVLALPARFANDALEILKRHPLGANATIIGRVRKDFIDSMESNIDFNATCNKPSLDFNATSSFNRAVDSMNALDSVNSTESLETLDSVDSIDSTKFMDSAKSLESLDSKNITDSIKSSQKPLDRIYFQKVVLFTKYGSKRFLEYPQGELLPRIC